MATTTLSGTPAGADASRFSRIRASLSPAEWGRLSGMAGFILLLHVVGWGVLLLAVVPGHYHLGTGGAFGVFTGLTAYTLGMRHAFDADHIAAIDNTTRKLMEDGKRPLSVGFWFSLGHSTVVTGLTIGLAFGMKSLGRQLMDDNSPLHSTGGLIGTAVSGGFLYLIGIFNLVILVGILKVFRAMRRGDYDEKTLEDHLDNRGMMNRFFGRAMKTVDKPWKIYPIGILFGLGFDTVTEVAFLVLASSGAIAGLPWYAIMCLPILFAAGMSLLDTIDGSFMNFAYGWAFSKPVRKVYYNIAVTGLSVAVALLVGTAELLAIAANKLSLTGGLWDWVQNIDLNKIGFVIVGMFVATWVVALGIWRFGRIEEKWTAGMAAGGPAELSTGSSLSAVTGTSAELREAGAAVSPSLVTSE